MADFFNEKALNQLAKQTGFIKRKSAKLLGHHFLNILVFMHLPDNKQSLRGYAVDCHNSFDIKITKQSLQKRFNKYAVRFMGEALSWLLHKHILPTGQPMGKLRAFNRVRIKDSTRFNLPASFKEKYTGIGGVANLSKAMMSIQYEYDLLSGQTLDLRLTRGTDNDQRDASVYTNDIEQGDLLIRDLGYATLNYFSKIISKGAFFLNRLHPQKKVYYKAKPDKEVDLKACLQKLKKYQLAYLSLEVLIGSEDKIPSRLIISQVDQRSYEKRLKSTAKAARSTENIKEDFRIRCRLNLFITNASEEDLPSRDVQSIYSLRWQIELIFKIWKSQATITAIKEVQIQRFECQLLGKMIYLVLHWKLFRWLDNRHRSKNKTRILSVWKYFTIAFQLSEVFRRTTLDNKKINEFLSILLDKPIEQLVLEPKNRKPNNYQRFMTY
ncbi:IS4 family transposase [Fulvivirga sp. M361]|uniref:IS4 family transposase n=1 Tax=Fulvivirga sp. M361 TaxID=2594266 RepID=UPI001179D0CA|nr:IS4 family transposase [Fulvivirga sp. M361]TRX53067.1 IS4 family transposase [Fulvivirga sp. M361]